MRHTLGGSCASAEYNAISSASRSDGSASGSEDDASIGGNVPSATDIDGDTLTYHLVAGSVEVDGAAAPDGTVTLNADGSYSYDPSGDQGLDDGESRTITFRYVANDGDEDSAEATITITVNGANDAPVSGGDDSASGSEDDASIGGTVPAASDVDVEDLTYHLVPGSVLVDSEAAPDGTVTLNADGTYSYTPTAGDQGLDTGELPWAPTLELRALGRKSQGAAAAFAAVHTDHVKIRHGVNLPRLPIRTG